MQDPKSQTRNPKPTDRLGLTLVELLVVIVILLILTAVAIPVMSPSSDQRRLREAARLVSTFLSGARSRALESGREVGVRFEPLDSNQNASMVLTYVEAPPSYPGDVVNATLRATIVDFNNNPPAPRVYLTLTFQTWQFNYTMIKVGDTVEAGGWSFPITGPDANGDEYIDDPGTSTTEIELTTYYDLEPNQFPDGVFPWAIRLDVNFTPADLWDDDWTGQSGPLSYGAILQLAKSVGTPLQLPEGIVVDLNWSGEGASRLIDRRRRKPPTIMFSPDGGIRKVYNFDNPLGHGAKGDRPPIGSLHFLVGKAEKAMPTGDPTDPNGAIYNYQDAGNLWVSVGWQTGLVSTAEVATFLDKNRNDVIDADESVVLGAGSQWAVDGWYSRSIAQTFQAMGGR